MSAQPVQGMSPSLLLQELRETLLRLGADRENRELARRAEQLEVEIDRRMAW